MLDSRHKIYKKLLLYTCYGRVQWVVTGVLYNEYTGLAQQQQSFKHPRILYNLKVNGLYSRRRRPHIKKQPPYRLSPVELV